MSGLECYIFRVRYEKQKMDELSPVLHNASKERLDRLEDELHEASLREFLKIKANGW